MHRVEPLRRLVDHPAFNALVLAVILANAATLALETYSGFARDHGDSLDLANDLFLAFFTAELALRIASYGRRPDNFFRSGWNVFDFVVIALGFAPGLRDNTTLLRLARLARVVRVVRILPDLRLLMTAVVRSLPPLFSMSVLTTLVLFLYGMVGWSIFGDSLPQHWGDIDTAMLTLFVMLTLENFPAYMEAGMEVHPWSWLYFVSFVLVAVFIVLNVLIGIVLNSMEEARELELRRMGGEPREHPAPVLERVAMLRSALAELEDELSK